MSGVVHLPRCRWWRRGRYGDDELGSGVLLGEMAEGLGGVGQRVGPLDHGDELSGFDERREGFEVAPGWFRDEHA